MATVLRVGSKETLVFCSPVGHVTNDSPLIVLIAGMPRAQSHPRSDSLCLLLSFSSHFLS